MDLIIIMILIRKKLVFYLINKNYFSPDKYKLIVVPSYRTPKNIIDMSFGVFGDDHVVVKSVDKKLI